MPAGLHWGRNGMGSCHHPVLTTETTESTQDAENHYIFFFFPKEIMRDPNTGKTITNIL